MLVRNFCREEGRGDAVLLESSLPYDLDSGQVCGAACVKTQAEMPI